MKLTDRVRLWAGRLRRAPQRDTTAYARLMNLGGWATSDKRPLIKATPANIRTFAKTPYARRAIRRIKDPIGNLEWEVVPKPGVEMNPEIQRQIDAATLCLSMPNADDSFRTFVEQLVEDALIGGAGTYEQQLGGDAARPLWMWPVDVMSIQIYPGWAGGANEARYSQSLGYGNIGGIQGKDLRNDELVYIRQDPTTETPFGIGPLEVAFTTINRKLGVADYAGNVASNAQPPVMLAFPGADTGWIAAFRNYWRNEVEGQGQMPIVGGASEKGVPQAIKLHSGNDDALFLKYQEWLVRETFVCFGLSPSNGGIERDVNRSTAETADDQDWDNAVVPMATNIAAHINRESIAGRLGFSQIQFQFVSLNRDDEKNTAEVFAIEYENNATTPNEYRSRTRKPPLEGPWGDMTSADVAIATAAARGAAVVDDPELSQGTPPAKPSAKQPPKGGAKGKK